MKTILIVDDEPDVADVVASALEDEGYRILVASNGIEGLKHLSQTGPDMLICDVMMPLMDGATMCSRIRGDPRHRDMVILISSVMDEQAIDAEFARYDGFLRKPFRRTALLALVNKLFEGKAAKA